MPKSIRNLGNRRPAPMKWGVAISLASEWNRWHSNDGPTANMKRLRRAVAIALLLAAAQAWPQAKDWIALPLGPTESLVLDATGDRTARLPVRILAAPANAASQAFDVRILDVAAKDGHGLRLVQAFHANWTPAQPHRLEPAIVVTVPHDAADVRPGTYTLSLRVSPDLRDDTLPAQSLTVTLTAAAPQLTADPVVIGQSIGLWPFERDESLDGVLRVSEHGGRAGAQALRVSAQGDIPATGMPVTGSLSVPTAAVDVGSGQGLALPIAASGPFPVGRSTGRIEVRSPDLDAPLTTTYEVRVARSASWMVPIVLAGFLLGYVTRTWLARAKARNAALLAASRVVAAIAAKQAVQRDAEFQARANAIRKTLQDAVALGVPQDITAAAAKAQSDIDDAQARLEQALAPLRQQATALQALVDQPWSLPSPVATAMAALRTDVASLQATLAAGDAGQAGTALSVDLAARLADVVNAVNACGAAAAGWMRALVDHPVPLSDADTALVVQSAQQLAHQYPWPVSDTPTAKVEDATSALLTWLGLSSATAKLLAQLQARAESFADWTAVRLRAAFPRIDTEAVALKAQARTVLNPDALALGLAGTADPAPLAVALAGLRDAWMAALHRLAPQAPLASVEQALEAGSWQRAIDAFNAIPASQFLGRADTRSIVATYDRLDDTGMPLRAAHETPPRLQVIATAPARPAVLEGTIAEQEHLLRSGEVASWLQSAVLAALFLAGNYLLYRESWVGTDREIVTLFMLAFGLDLSADNVLAALRKA